jgi:hypothetical protein
MGWELIFNNIRVGLSILSLRNATSLVRGFCFPKNRGAAKLLWAGGGRSARFAY